MRNPESGVHPVTVGELLELTGGLEALLGVELGYPQTNGVPERVGAWILADEVYRGGERVGDAETPTFHGRYDKILALGSLSKEYGLPGLRLGRVVGPKAAVSTASPPMPRPSPSSATRWTSRQPSSSNT